MYYNKTVFFIYLTHILHRNSKILYSMLYASSTIRYKIHIGIRHENVPDAKLSSTNIMQHSLFLLCMRKYEDIKFFTNLARNNRIILAICYHHNIMYEMLEIKTFLEDMFQFISFLIREREVGQVYYIFIHTCWVSRQFK